MSRFYQEKGVVLTLTGQVLLWEWTITRQVLGRPACDRGAIPENEKLYADYFVAFQL